MIQTLHQWQHHFVNDDVRLCAEAVADYTDELTPGETQVITSSVSIRQNTYSTGRHCAKAALREIDVHPRDYADGLLRKEDGAVDWPEPAIGSISHTNDWAVAAVAKAGGRYASLGVDIERIDRVEKGVLRLIATDDERAYLESAYELRWGRVALFSIKESLYKCLRPLYGQFIGFKDVQISKLTTPLSGTTTTAMEGVLPEQAAVIPELYAPSVKLILPALTQCCDEQRGLLSMKKFTRVAAYGLIVNESKLLLCRLTPLSPAQTVPPWTLPGGGLDFGESPEDAVVREVLEETGLQVSVDTLIDVRSTLNDQEDHQQHNIQIVYRATYLSGQLRYEMNGSTDKCDWLTEPQARKLPLVGVAKTAVQLAFA